MATPNPETSAHAADDPALTLALAYANRRARPVLDDLFALDRRLADAVRQASEPIIAQMKLAWWRDRFAQDPADWPKGEPLLARLAGWDADVSQLVSLVNGWEHLLAVGQLTQDAIVAFAEGRADAWAVAVRTLRQDSDLAYRHAALLWSCADLAAHCSQAEDAERVRGFVDDQSLLSRKHQTLDLRTFAVLGALGERSLRSGRPILSGPADFLAAVRAGMLGR